MFAQSQAFTFTQADGAGQAQAAKKSRQEEKQTCLPVTIRALQLAVEQRAEAGGELRVYGSEHGVLLLVALVESMSRQAASVELSLNDATGRIKARHYLSQHTHRELDDLAPGCYVCAFGSVRTAPELHFAVAGMNLVQHADEVSYHMVEAAYAAFKLLKGRSEPATPVPSSGLAVAEVTPPKADGPKPNAEAGPVAAPKEPLTGTALRKAIYRFIQKEGEGRVEGMSFAAVCNHVDPAPGNEVSAALEKLVDAGELYTTIDEGHFQVL